MGNTTAKQSGLLEPSIPVLVCQPGSLDGLRALSVQLIIRDEIIQKAANRVWSNLVYGAPFGTEKI